MDVFFLISHWLKTLAHTTPLPVFVSISSLLEEVIAPIVLAPILVIAGSIAHAQGATVLTLLLLSLLSSLSKTLGSWVLYYLGIFAENVIVNKWGAFFGINAKNVESFGKRFQKGHSDIILLTFLRALPILPSAPISIACGVIRLNMPVFLIATFIGNIPKAFIPLYAGFAGINVFHRILRRINTVGGYITLTVIIIVALFLAWRFWKYYKNNHTPPTD